jgi:hypothetical protein
MAADAPSRDERIPAASTDEEQVLAYGADVKVRPREDRTCTYVLRAEPGWEGREPVPVVTRAGSCDAATECRPSREGAMLRLCVEPLDDRPAGARSAERTTEFRQRGRY